MITQNRLKELLRYSPDTGTFTWVKSRVGAKEGDIAGCLARGYIVIRVDDELHRAHRLAWLYAHGVWPTQIDHIDHNKDNNRLSNLREASQAENMKNQTIRAAYNSCVTGVRWHNQHNIWHSQIRVGGKSIHLGYFKDKFEAICARMSANNKYGFHENHGK